MQTEILILLVFIIAFLFYGFVPGIGAFTVRAQWRNFRRRIIEASLFPFVKYSDLSNEGKLLGKYRVFGFLEAIQGKNRIWINNGSFTVEVDLEGVKLYLLPSYSLRDKENPFEMLDETLPDQEPKSVPWNRIFSLTAGTRIFVGGLLFSEDGRGVFRSQPKEPLVVVIYDGEKKSILLRAIWGGRQKNEYWNQYTLASLITGSFSLLLIAYIFLRTPILHLPSLFALSLGFFPVAILLPPGVVLYFLYRYLWKKARLLRAERDLLRLPLRYFKEIRDTVNSKESLIRLPTGESYIMTSDAGFLIRDGLSIRGCRLLNLTESRKEDYYIFGAYNENENGGCIIEPDDPMAELILIMGDPVKLAEACNKKARMFELLSAFFVFSGIIINLFIILYVWHYLIR